MISKQPHATLSTTLNAYEMSSKSRYPYKTTTSLWISTHQWIKDKTKKLKEGENYLGSGTQISAP